MDKDELIRTIKWKDLRKLSFFERFIENNIQVPWAILSWILVSYDLYFIAIPFSIIFFATAFRQAHNGIHFSLGNGKFLNWWVLYLNSITMVASSYAIRFHHLRHHRFNLNENDLEGKPAKMNALQALFHGPIYYFQCHLIALKLEKNQIKILMIFELFSTIIFYSLVYYFKIYFLIYHLIIMLIGQMLTPFMAVWLVHRGQITRTTRNKWISWLSVHMFFHLEHHLFPSVPTIKMNELVKRVDIVSPELIHKHNII